MTMNYNFGNKEVVDGQKDDDNAEDDEDDDDDGDDEDGDDDDDMKLRKRKGNVSDVIRPLTRSNGRRLPWQLVMLERKARA